MKRRVTIIIEGDDGSNKCETSINFSHPHQLGSKVKSDNPAFYTADIIMQAISKAATHVKVMSMNTRNLEN